jgi:hypothetical protein
MVLVYSPVEGEADACKNGQSAVTVVCMLASQSANAAECSLTFGLWLCVLVFSCFCSVVLKWTLS